MSFTMVGSDSHVTIVIDHGLRLAKHLLDLNDGLIEGYISIYPIIKKL